MVAPNGARKTRHDHPALPVSVEDTVEEAVQCHAAGASALHAHVRGKNDEHLLDAGLYRELLAEMSRRAPEMLVQITSEAVGIYTPAEQVDCIQAVIPQMISMSLREISANFEQPGYARQFFEWCDENAVHVQHIVYSPEEFQHFLDYRNQGIIPAGHRCILFVLGKYDPDFQSGPIDLEPFLQHDLTDLDWFTCAFGSQEQQCVMAAINAGGHARIGFENNLYLPSGEVAASTADLVSSLVDNMSSQGFRPASAARQLLGVRNA